MTKAEQKKLEQVAKAEFINTSLGCVLEAIRESSGKTSSSTQIRIDLQRRNRYIRFHRYGEDFNIQIYRSGDVDIEFKEFCHEPRKYRIFAYDPDKEVQTSFLEQFRQDMRMVIVEFLERADWHTILDFMPMDSDDWREAFIHSLEFAVNPEEPHRWNPDWTNN